LFPESRVIAPEDVVEEIVPAQQGYGSLLMAAMVSIEGTPVNAPPVVTF